VNVSTTAQLVSALASASSGETIVLAAGTYAPSAALAVSVAGLKIEGPTSGAEAILSGGSVSQTTSDGDIIDVSSTASLTLADVSIRSTVTGATAAIDDQGSLDLESSDVQGNQVSPIFADGGTAVIRNSTIADNSFANSVAGVNDSGGGDVKLFNDTIAYNDFGLANGGVGGTAEVVNTMIVKNTHADCTAHVTTADASMDSAGTCGGGTVTGITQQASPGITASPGVGANGGTTQTIALLAGSPAIAGGDNSNCPATDQRGVARTGHCDLGAYQAAAATTVTVTLTFDANGGTGSMSPEVFTPAMAEALTANGFARTGFTFAGWNTKADGTGTSYSDGQSITVPASLTLYAQWTAKPASQAAKMASQTVGFTSTAPSKAVVGGIYTPTATASSGLSVLITIDSSSRGTCSISGVVVTFTAVGSCVLDANQAGNGTYPAAPQVQQTVIVRKASHINPCPGCNCWLRWLCEAQELLGNNGFAVRGLSTEDRIRVDLGVFLVAFGIDDHVVQTQRRRLR
jgi:uncharacterized repeat protein (TIGR02543 family)